MPPVDHCAGLRSFLQAKRDEIKGLQGFRASLQQLLNTSSPQAKAGIVKEITAVNAEIAAAEAELPRRETRLKLCETVFNPVGPVTGAGKAQDESPSTESG